MSFYHVDITHILCLLISLWEFNCKINLSLSFPPSEVISFMLKLSLFLSLSLSLSLSHTHTHHTHCVDNNLNMAKLKGRFLAFILSDTRLPNFFLQWFFFSDLTCILSSAGKKSTYNTGDPGSITGLGRSLGGGHGSPLQYSCLENPHGQWSLAGYSL